MLIKIGPDLTECQSPSVDFKISANSISFKGKLILNELAGKHQKMQIVSGQCQQKTWPSSLRGTTPTGNITKISDLLTLITQASYFYLPPTLVGGCGLVEQGNQFCQAGDQEVGGGKINILIQLVANDDARNTCLACG